MSVEKKKCKRCKQIKPLTSYDRHPTSGDGRQTRCKSCWTLDRAERKKQRYSANQCQRCQKRAAPGRSMCLFHLDDNKRKSRKRILSRKCRSCSKRPMDGKQICAECSSLRSAFIKKLADRGICIYCRKEAATAKQWCGTCWFKRNASKYLGSAGRYRELMSLWDKQSGLCALSGIKLIRGTNASLDHIVPRAKGGANTISNYRWIDWDVNLARKDLLDDEFIEMCQRVVDHADSKKRLRLVYSCPSDQP